MLNLLLAIFYSNFARRFSNNIDANAPARTEYLIEAFRSFDQGDKGYLNKKETQSFFDEIHSLAEGKYEVEMENVVESWQFE